MRLRSALGAALFLLPLAAQAEPIPPVALAEVRQSCIAACTQQGIPLATCTPYCDCFAKSLGQKFTLEEYAAVNAAAQQDKAPPKDAVTRMADIAKSCHASLK
jgi:hypothetical protein